MKSLDCYVGIDLGSTTTKAVVLDAEDHVLGKGITNSRSNYDVACNVARSEAFVDAQMNRLRKALEGTANLREYAGVLGTSLERSFRYCQHMRQLERLAESSLLLAAGKAELLSALVEIFDSMRDEAEKAYSGIAAHERKSEFFRDIAGGQFQRLAEKRADARRLPYDAIVGVYDRAILGVENDPGDLSFQGNATSALERTLERWGRATDAIRADAKVSLESIIDNPLVVRCSVGTGYGRARLPFPKSQIRSEILCHGLGAHRLFPKTRTVLDIGGQDTKGIQIDAEGIVTSFQMNDRCAAGCGRYLGYIADEMNLGVHELGPLAEKATRHVRISSTCTVFAGAELRDRLSLGEKREDILAGLHRAIILRAMSILARSGGVFDEFTFTGGVAHNTAAVRALRELIFENYGERTINTSGNSIYTGALGAAMFAMRETQQQVCQGAKAPEVRV